MTNASLDPSDAFALLVAAPGTKEDKQRFFRDQLEIRVPRTNYDVMWDRLVDELGEGKACEGVCSLVLATHDSRAIKLLDRAARGEQVTLRVDEPALVDLLFDKNDELTTIGEVLAARLPSAQPPVAKASAFRSSQLPRKELPDQPRAPQSTDEADVILKWHRADPHSLDRGPWRWCGCLYAYVHPASLEVLYIGKADDMTVRERFVSNFKRKFQDLYARLGILKVDVIVAEVQLITSSRLTREWLDDLESLLIFRLQPTLNDSKRKSRGATRPGTVVVCSGDWPATRARFIDKG